ncbi:MAG: choice-of-anchor X domain-containing protein [Bacteroidota bacterium]
MPLRCTRRPSSWAPLQPALMLLFFLVASGCDTSPGADDRSLVQRQPVLSGFTFTPSEVVFEELPDTQVRGEEVDLPLRAAFSVTDPDGDLRAVTVVVTAPSPVGFTSGGAPIFTVGGVTLEATTDGAYVAETTITLPSSAIGRYTVRAQAIDDAGLISNEVVGFFTYTSANEPPVIEAVESIPDRIDLANLPDSFVIIATASDPDNNIVRVFGQTPTGFEFDLFDDGASSGDEVAGDGRYTATFSAAPTTPGTQTFTIQAIDRGGLESEVVTLDVVIQ